jgi:hypothetical protein
MRKNRLTFWFFTGFIIYGTLTALFGVFSGNGGAVAWAALFYIGAAFCGLKLWLDKVTF